MGQACSMGSLLLTAGSPGLRHALPHARVMVHQPHGGARVCCCFHFFVDIPLKVVTQMFEKHQDPLNFNLT